MFMDFAMLPPEVNSTRMYSGPGAGSLWAAAAAWDQVSAELQSAAETYRSVIASLTGWQWLGPSSVRMGAAVTPDHHRRAGKADGHPDHRGRDRI